MIVSASRIGTPAPSSYSNIVVLCFSGVTAFDQQSGAGAGSIGSGASTQQPGSITPAVANSLVLVGASFFTAALADGGTISVDGGFTVSDQKAFSNGNYWGVGAAYLTGVSGATNPTVTFSVPCGEAVGMVVFKP
jgi:hypothetical protein